MPSSTTPVSREEFEQFLHAFTHELRNRLNGIALEATDLAEQAGPDADASRLQRQVQECSTLLRATRDLLAPDAPGAEAMELGEYLRKLRERRV